MDSKDTAFLMEIQRLAIEMDALVDKYEMRDRFISVLVSGFFDENEFGDIKINAIYSYHLQSIFEAEEIIHFINGTFDPESQKEYDQDDFDKDVDDMLDDLGIEKE
tara:strand:+ start:18 stop:335 length:318 start_codon:yes stop_codon:yes gene_type:complete